MLSAFERKTHRVCVIFISLLPENCATFDQIPLEIRWIPAHVGVSGNETVDIEANSQQLPADGSAANKIQSPSNCVVLALTHER